MGVFSSRKRKASSDSFAFIKAPPAHFGLSRRMIQIQALRISAAIQFNTTECYSHGQGMSNQAGILGGKNGKGVMSKKEQFLAFVLVGAMAQDVSKQSNDCPLIMHTAGQIPEEQIPDNVMNAAKVFLAYCNGVYERPHAWMLIRR